MWRVLRWVQVVSGLGGGDCCVDFFPDAYANAAVVLFWLHFIKISKVFAGPFERIKNACHSCEIHLSASRIIP